MSDKSNETLSELRKDMLTGDITSLPIAGLLFWTTAAIFGMLLDAVSFAYFVLYGSGMIFFLGVVVSRVRGKNMLEGGSDNPLTKLFILSIVMLASLIPVIIFGAAGQPTLVVLGLAIISGNIWIAWGWTAGTSIGLYHAMGRMLGCYIAYLFVPEPLNQTVICGVVVLAYTYSLIMMRKL